MLGHFLIAIVLTDYYCTRPKFHVVERKFQLCRFKTSGDSDALQLEGRPLSRQSYTFYALITSPIMHQSIGL